MKIGLVLDPFGVPSAKGSAGAFHSLVEALIEGSPEDSFTCYAKPELLDDAIDAFPRASIRNLGSSPVSLLGALRLDPSLDVYVFMTPIIPLFFRPKRAVVIAQDFDFLERRSPNLKKWLKARIVRFLQARSLAKADRVVAITENTKAQAVRFFRISEEKITVVPIAYRRPSEELKEVDISQPFIFFAGALKERKNVHGIIEAFAQFHTSHPDYVLAIAGKTGGPYYRSLLPRIAELGIVESVRFLGFVDDQQLSWLYRNAEMFVFPSLVEGFGMPVLEAMSVGTPVITSSSGALAEVAGDAALTADPRNPTDLALHMSTFADDAAIRERYIALGRARAGDFSWGKTATRLRTLI